MVGRVPILVIAAILVIAPLATADAATGAIACANGESCVLVTVDGGAPTTRVSYAEVAAGDVNASYAFRPQAGAPTNQAPIQGISLRSIAENKANVLIGAVKYVEISTGSGTLFAISGDDLALPSPFPDGTVPVVYTNSTDSLGYVTPLRSDDQPNDEGVTANGGAVSVTIHTTGSLLRPSVTVDHSAVDTGSAVAFTASFASDPGTAIDYHWEFGDGAAATGAATESHVYSASGTYQATLTTRGADGSLGIARSELITVGTPAPPTNAGGAGSGAVTATHAPTTGPTRSRGHTAGSTSKPTRRPTSKPTSVPSSKPTPRPSATGTTAPRATATPISTPAPTTTATAAPVARATGSPVTGLLISGDAVTVGGGPSPARASAAAGRAGSRAALGWGSAAVAGTVVLLGAGVLIESGLFGSLLARIKRRIR